MAVNVCNTTKADRDDILTENENRIALSMRDRENEKGPSTSLASGCEIRDIKTVDGVIRDGRSVSERIEESGLVRLFSKGGLNWGSGQTIILANGSC